MASSNSAGERVRDQRRICIAGFVAGLSFGLYSFSGFVATLGESRIDIVLFLGLCVCFFLISFADLLQIPPIHTFASSLNDSLLPTPGTPCQLRYAVTTRPHHQDKDEVLPFVFGVNFSIYFAYIPSLFRSHHREEDIQWGWGLQNTNSKG